jgi:hypothetical protein
MTAYYIYFSLLWCCGLFDFVFKKKQIYYFSVAVFLFFISLRYETGYDWPVYKKVFDNIRGMVTWTELTEACKTYSMEPLFLLMVSLLKSITDDFQILIIFVYIIEVYALHKFLKIFYCGRALTIAVIGTWLLFSLYFSVLRQGLAVSFFLLFYVSNFYRNNLKAFLFFLFSITTQFSSIIYYLLFFCTKYHFTKKSFLTLAIFSFVFSFFSAPISNLIFEAISRLNIPVLSAKTEWYAHGRIVHTNTFDLVYVYIYGGVFSYFLYKVWPIYNNTLYHPLLIFSSVFIFIQFFFIDYPLLRNRIQYVAFLMQFLIFIDYFYKKTFTERLIVFSSLMIVFFGYFSLFLIKESSLPLIPYQDYIRYGMLNKQSDGLERNVIALEKAREQ